MKLKINDVSLRDGNHALAHSIDLDFIAEYCDKMDNTGIYSVEVGHGNGLGASSLQVGLSLENEGDMLKAARKNLNNTRLCVHSIPSFSTIKKNIDNAINLGVDVFRIGTHCTEGDITERHINYLKGKKKEVYGAMMMIHMTTTKTLLEECRKIESYGADGIVLMDSVGYFTNDKVFELIGELNKNLNINVGFHAHNNLGMAITNSLDALKAGAKLLDASSAGLGAGAGNTQLEVLIAILNKKYKLAYSFEKIMACANMIRKNYSKDLPKLDDSSIFSGLYGVFSGFKKHVQRISLQYGIREHDIWYELGKHNVIAGQEDLIFDIALKLKKNH